MNILDSIKELFDSIGVALSLKTLQTQWKDMLGMFAPKREKEKPVVTDMTRTVLKMRIGYGRWPHGKGTVITARKQNFTFGNSDIFDVCLDPGNEQVGDVWCSVFFDETLGGYVLMQATGSFNVRVTGDSEPYRPGDWSLFPNGLSYQTFPQSNVLVPLSDKNSPEKVLFSIGNAYFFESWACALTDEDAWEEPDKSDETDEEAPPMPAPARIDAEVEEADRVQPAPAVTVVTQPVQIESVTQKTAVAAAEPQVAVAVEPVVQEPLQPQPVVAEDIPAVPAPVVQETLVPMAAAEKPAPEVINPFEMASMEIQSTASCRKEPQPTVSMTPPTELTEKTTLSEKEENE